MTPLHWAVEKRFPRIVNLLLQHGADPVALSKFEKTPITLAFESKQNDILQELSAHKGRVEEVCFVGGNRNCHFTKDLIFLFINLYSKPLQIV